MRKNTFRRVISIFVIMFLFATVLLPVASASTPAWKTHRLNIPFEDVPRHEWYYDTVSWAWVNRITGGRTQTAFAPNAFVTRAEFAAFMHRIYGGESIPTTTARVFDDVRPTDWFWNPIMWAQREGIIREASPNRAAPNRNITRQEIAAMLQRAIEGATPPHVNPTPAFNRLPDRFAVDNWAANAVRWGVANGIIGRGDYLAARDNASRAEALTMVRRLANNFNIVLGAADPWTDPFLDVLPIPSRDVYIPVIDRSTVTVLPTDNDGNPGNLVVGSPTNYDITVVDTGLHSLELSTLAHHNGRVRVEVIRKSDSLVIQPSTPMWFRDVIEMNLTAATEYTVNVASYTDASGLGTTGEFQFHLLRQKPIVNISGLRNTIEIVNVTDYMEFIGQKNEYRFQTPTTTGTGRIPASGTYRFDITRIGTGDIRAVVGLEIFIEVGDGRDPVLLENRLVWGQGVNVTLLDNRSYIIRVNYISPAGGEGTVMGQYSLRVSPQKGATPIPRMHNDPDIRQTRISLVDDHFQFIGQQNTYTFYAPATGWFQFRPNLLPGQSRVELVNHLNEGDHRYIRAGEIFHVFLEEGIPYRLRMIHLVGNPLGAYSFTIVYPW